MCGLRFVGRFAVFPYLFGGVQDSLDGEFLVVHRFPQVPCGFVLAAISANFRTYEVLGSAPINLGKCAQPNPTLFPVDAHKDAVEELSFDISFCFTGYALVEEFEDATLCKRTCTVQFYGLRVHNPWLLSTGFAWHCRHFFFDKWYHCFENFTIYWNGLSYPIKEKGRLFSLFVFFFWVEDSSLIRLGKSEFAKEGMCLVEFFEWHQRVLRTRIGFLPLLAFIPIHSTAFFLPGLQFITLLVVPVQSFYEVGNLVLVCDVQVHG